MSSWYQINVFLNPPSPFAGSTSKTSKPQKLENCQKLFSDMSLKDLKNFKNFKTFKTSKTAKKYSLICLSKTSTSKTSKTSKPQKLENCQTILWYVSLHSTLNSYLETLLVQEIKKLWKSFKGILNLCCQSTEDEDVVCCSGRWPKRAKGTSSTKRSWGTLWGDTSLRC